MEFTVNNFLENRNI